MTLFGEKLSPLQIEAKQKINHVEEIARRIGYTIKQDGPHEENGHWVVAVRVTDDRTEPPFVRTFFQTVFKKPEEEKRIQTILPLPLSMEVVSDEQIEQYLRLKWEENTRKSQNVDTWRKTVAEKAIRLQREILQLGLHVEALTKHEKDMLWFQVSDEEHGPTVLYFRVPLLPTGHCYAIGAVVQDWEDHKREITATKLDYFLNRIHVYCQLYCRKRAERLATYSRQKAA